MKRNAAPVAICILLHCFTALSTKRITIILISNTIHTKYVSVRTKVGCFQLTTHKYSLENYRAINEGNC